MKKIIPSLAAVAIMGFSATVTSSETLRFGVDVPTAPMEFRLPSGELTGFDIELGNALCEQINRSCEWVEQEWSGIIPGLTSRKYDAIMSSMTINDSRRKKVLFSDPYIKPYSAWFGADTLEMEKVSKDNLEGKTIGVQRGTLQDSYVTDQFGMVADVNRYSTTTDMIMDIKTGRVDLIFLDHPAGVATLLENSDGYRIVGELVNEPERYFGEGFGIAFRQRDEELAEQFNAALLELKENGTYDEIYQKYFPEN
ncbi:transporter substrate-binding domain-containing protein [Halomonas halocynthiae]|uniref:transporter substrate-binding domain-containing protein n=1 Tax=Halomonas halocynthiae TaxID=176290 RepID=UPI00042073C4|nr:transporter substrate-binding domain-containing protein [Halomonas halocynthiae]